MVDWKRLFGIAQDDLEVRHTDTEPSAYPIEWQLDAVVWHQGHGPLSAEAVPAVYAAIDLIAGAVARLETDPDTPLTRRPDQFDSRFAFFFETVWSLCWAGDAFWLLTPTDRGVDSMQVLDPSTVDVTWNDTFGRSLRDYRWNGKAIARDRIAHLRFHPRPGELLGLSPIEAAYLTWAGAAASEAWGSSLFESSGVPSGVLQVPTPLTKTETDALREQWNKARSGGRNTAVLSGGATYEAVELSPADIEWLSTRASTAQEVARIFHIPSDMLEVSVQGGSTSITYRNLAAIGADFVGYALAPYLRILEEAWAALPGQPAIAFDTTPLFEEDLQTRANTFSTLTAAGVPFSQAGAVTGFDFTPAPTPTPTPAPAPEEVPV